MEIRQLGRLWPVSALTLGGGGLGQVWGQTSRTEAIATVRAAVDSGINFLDMAPLYGKGEAEVVVGEAFDGQLPDGVHISSKCMVGTLEPAAMLEKMERSIIRSLKSMRRERLDTFILHSQILPDGYQLSGHEETQHTWTVNWSCYQQSVIPAMEQLQKKGLIADWGITGVGLPSTIRDALSLPVKPAVVQVIANLMDSAGGIRRFDEAAEPRRIIACAKEQGVAVMGIRAVQAGALTAAMDRVLAADDAEQLDFARAQPWRELCLELNENPAVLAHRYALAMAGVDTVVLGVKNRQEQAQIVDGHNLGPLDPDTIARIDSLGLRR